MTSTCPNTSTYRRIANSSAKRAIREWLNSLRRPGRYLFVLDGVECLVEFFEGYWGGVEPFGTEGGGRWRWGRADAGDPDEDMSGENVLLDIALGRELTPRPQPRARRSTRDFPAPNRGTRLTVAEIRERSFADAAANLQKVALCRLPAI